MRLVPRTSREEEETTPSSKPHYTSAGHSTMKPKIHVVVVESHQHALEHIHHVLRRRRLLNSPWSMLHFDSHADLACPGEHVPAVSCFRPRETYEYRKTQIQPKGEIDQSDATLSATRSMDLYELLDATASGIAEWIIPLVVAANLSAVHWIRPPGTIRQIPQGEHEVVVGAWIEPDNVADAIKSFVDLPVEAKIKTSFDCCYYLDDDSYAPENELHLTKTLNLKVSEAHPDSFVLTTRTLGDCEGFALDICLDFFACRNPFLSDIEDEDAPLSVAFQAAVNGSIFYSKLESQTETALLFRRDIKTFRWLWRQFLESCNDCAVTGADVPPYKALLQYYSDSVTGSALLDTVRRLLLRHKSRRKKLIDMTLDTFPNLTMPHCSKQTKFKEMIKERLLFMGQQLDSVPTATPFIITIARSSDDGFTPAAVVEKLQSEVLQTMHNRYCGCSSSPFDNHFVGHPTTGSPLACRLDVIFDYGQWEGSSFC